jgi:uncharacterized membrane protein
MNDIREASLETDDSGLPGGALGQLLPFLILAAGGAWLYVHWDQIPARVPMHWDFRGKVDHYGTRTPLHVAMPLILGAFSCLVVHVTAWLMRSSSPRGASRKPSLQMMLAAELFIAVVCCFVTIMAARGVTSFLPILLFLVFLLVAVVATALALFANVRKQEPLRNPPAWHSLYYSDPEDPALFVPKRRGYGYTINFGHPAAVPFMVGVVMVPLVAGIAAALLQR